MGLRIRVSSRIRWKFAGITILGFACWRITGVHAADLRDPTVLDAELQTGEFAPALARARTMDSRDGRDGIFSKVALAQAQAGDRVAALQTVSQIDDDRTASESLSAVRSQPMPRPGRP